MKKLKIDKNKCIGCGTCVALAGKSFCLNKDNKAELIKPAGDDEKTIQEAIKGCPVEAISDE